MQLLQLFATQCLSSVPILLSILCQQHQPPDLFHLVPQGISVPSLQPVMLGKKICSLHLHPHLIEISAKNSVLIWNPGKTRGRTGNRNQRRISQPCPDSSSINMGLWLSSSLHDLIAVAFILPRPSPSVFGPPFLAQSEYKSHYSAETPCFSIYFEQHSTFLNLFNITGSMKIIVDNLENGIHSHFVTSPEENIIFIWKNVEGVEWDITRFEHASLTGSVADEMLYSQKHVVWTKNCRNQWQ